MSRWFPIMLFLVALLIAGNAAYFSVKGIGLLFAGSFLPVIIMASSLEIGKLFAVSFLYRKWYDMKFFMKTYLSVASLLLMIITSLGIFGFLSDAYQDTKTKVELYEAKIVSVQNEITNYQEQIKTIETARTAVDSKTTDAINNYKTIYEAFETRTNDRIQLLNKRLATMDQTMSDLQNEKGGLFSNKKSKIEALKTEQQPERVAIASEIEQLNMELTSQYKQYLAKVDDLSQDTKSNLTTQQQTEPLYIKVREREDDISEYRSLISDTDIGSFRFIANAFDIETDTAVKWFMIMIVIVFDPLAVCLIIGYNMYVMRTPYDGYKREKPEGWEWEDAWVPVKQTLTKLIKTRHPRKRSEGK